jgi:hypothetical protein
MLGSLGGHSRPQSFHELHTLEEDHATPDGDDDGKKANNQEDEDGDELEQEEPQDDAASTLTLTDGEIEEQYEAFAQDEEDLEASLGLSGSGLETLTSQPPESQEEEQEEGREQEPPEEEEEDDDDFRHVDSSPCVIAEIKKGKRAPFFGRTFKPLSLGKPLALSLLPPNRARARGMERTASSIV